MVGENIRIGGNKKSWPWVKGCVVCCIAISGLQAQQSNKYNLAGRPQNLLESAKRSQTALRGNKKPLPQTWRNGRCCQTKHRNYPQGIAIGKMVAARCLSFQVSG
jgi:hypothetical protein